MPVIVVDNTEGGKKIASVNSRRTRIIIQNVGGEPAIFKIDGDPATDSFDFVLASDTADRAGNGGSVTLEGTPGKIKALTEANDTEIAVTEVYD